MKKSFLNKVKKILNDEKHTILRSVKQDVNIDTDGDEVDLIQGNLLIELTNQLSFRNSTKLFHIEEALKHIENKTYGLCKDCEEVIPEKRLLHNPHFQTCVDCAEERENEAKQLKRF
jgi:DnaK suppressor protein